MATVHELDMDTANAFAFKLFGDLATIQVGTLMAIADRLSLFSALERIQPATSAEFASEAGIDERYAREWLSALACHRVVAFDSATGRFTLPAEHAYCLTNTVSPVYLGSVFAMLPNMWHNIDRLTEAFQTGGGVPQSHFGEEFWCGFERMTRTGFVNNLCQDWIPALSDAHQRLLAGGTAADIGCGNGQAIIELAKGYPSARCVGLDSFGPAIESARANARAAGVDDRVSFEVCDVTQGISGSYDLITSFDVVHDMPFPRPALAEVRHSLTSGGTYFVLEFNLSGDLQENIDHPLGLGTFGYAASCNYCMTQALAVGGEGTGTCMGEEKLRAMAAEAGFSQVRRLDFPQNPLHVCYEIRA